MISFPQFSKYLQIQWQDFVPSSASTVLAGPIQSGLDEGLLKNLKQSRFFSEKKPTHQMSATREKEWAEARRLELKMEEYYSSKDLNDVLLLSSISHSSQGETPIVVAASVLEKKSNPRIQGIGIDIESESRNISAEVAARFLKPKETLSEVSDLELWVLKEAAFKATPRDLQLVVSEYRLAKWDKASHQGEMVSKSARCAVKLVKNLGYVIGLSYFSF